MRPGPDSTSADSTGSAEPVDDSSAPVDDAAASVDTGTPAVEPGETPEEPVEPGREPVAPADGAVEPVDEAVEPGEEPVVPAGDRGERAEEPVSSDATAAPGAVTSQIIPAEQQLDRSSNGSDSANESINAPDDASAKTEKPDREWWDDERMPWKGKPTRADIGCWVAITAVGIFALVMLPLRPVLLGYTPYVLVGLTGSRTGMVTIGALGATGDPWWPVGLLIGIVSIVKFDLIYFWAGKLWGRGLLEVMAGRSVRARRNAERAERWALKYATPAVALTYLPIPIPAAVIYATVAMAGMSWRKFIIVNLICATVLQTGWLALGWSLGAPAVRVVEIYADYSMYLSIAILVGMIAVYVWRSNRNKAEAANRSNAETPRG